MQISFGMIFSIILIVIFIGFAIYVIIKFLDFGESNRAVVFMNELQEDIDKMWAGSGGQETREYSLPKETEKICFVDFSSPANNLLEEYSEFELVSQGKNNLFLYPLSSGRGFDSKQIINIDLDKITKTRNPYCIDSARSKITIEISKDFKETLVSLK